MRLQGEVIGDDSIDSDIEKLASNVDRMPETMDNSADKITNRAQSIARSKGLYRTGAGVAGITHERAGDDRLIGWARRPNFHLFFFETGTYKDYPRPHLRPAADQMENEILNDIEQNIVGD